VSASVVMDAAHPTTGVRYVSLNVSGALMPRPLRLDLSERFRGSGGARKAIARGGPIARQQLVEAIVRPEIDEADEDIGKPALRVDAVELCGFNQRGEHGPVPGTVVVAGEERVLSGERKHPFILPMSGMSWKSTTDGTRISAVRSPCGGSSSERRASF
jgi:hypothetical protein